jgi:hypothetical protein
MISNDQTYRRRLIGGYSNTIELDEFIRFNELSFQMLFLQSNPSVADFINRHEIPKNNKNSTSKYKFNLNSNYTCGYCYENFKSNQIMCINFCYHYWCNECNEQLNINKCGQLDLYKS